MSQTDKLLKKLENGSITGPELDTLLAKLGWELKRTTGSHVIWGNKKGKRLTLVANRKKLLPYQIKEARKALEHEDEEDT